MAFPFAIVGELVLDIGQSLTNKYISSKGAKDTLDFVFNLAEQGLMTEERFAALRSELRLNQEKARAEGKVWEPELSEIEAIWASIEARDKEWDRV